MEKIEMSQTCRICGAHNDGIWYSVKEMMYGFRDEFLYFQCINCECLQISEIPRNMSKYYPEQYYSFKVYDGKKFKGFRGKIKTFIYQASLTPNNLIRKTVKAVFPTNNFEEFEGVKLTTDSRILDVGCGNGDKYLYPLAEMEYKHLLGCDPYISDTIYYPNGLQIKRSDVLEVKGTWDVIIYHHSFEHISNPLENLQQVKRLLAKDGVCIISIPTVSSYAWRHYKTNWYQLDAPRHFFLHSLKSMDYLARKVGLSLAKTHFTSDYKQFVISEKYVQDMPMIAPNVKGAIASIKRKLLKLKYNRIARKLNEKGEGDLAVFYLTNIKEK